ncbi:hydrogenase maturation nickel metallochaperone HypA [Dehalobacter sp. DCM]|uniref:hydrogenase maturation nickel metallochaperone HypA n=1 Tax=Dehalobacter sp. DCM TaxID=2907827 RepID=UPI003081A9C8|nr:hydrogenase maturation nickel metallochaperone HypA [Dehalobacter sp. DCM]
MHELAVSKSILSLVLKNAEQKKANKVLAIYLAIGEMRKLEQDWLQRYFDYISKGTIAEGVHIEVKKVPVVFECKLCGKEFSVNLHEDKKLLCPFCDGFEYTLLSGRELLVEKMEVR